MTACSALLLEAMVVLNQRFNVILFFVHRDKLDACCHFGRLRGMLSPLRPGFPQIIMKHWLNYNRESVAAMANEAHKSNTVIGKVVQTL